MWVLQMSLLQNWFSLINFTPGYFHPFPFCLLLYSREESSCIKCFFSCCNSCKCFWFLSSLSSNHCSRGLLTADLHRFLVNTEPLWILVTESRCGRLWILLCASCPSWYRILGNSISDSRHTFPMVPWGTIWIGISILSYSELFWASMDWKQEWYLSLYFYLVGNKKIQALQSLAP